MNEIEKLEAAHTAAYYAYLDAARAYDAATNAYADLDIDDDAPYADLSDAADAAYANLADADAADAAVAASRAARDIARTRMFSAARAFDSAIDNDNDNDNDKRIKDD